MRPRSKLSTTLIMPTKAAHAPRCPTLGLMEPTTNFFCLCESANRDSMADNSMGLPMAVPVPCRRVSACLYLHRTAGSSHMGLYVLDVSWKKALASVQGVHVLALSFRRRHRNTVGSSILVDSCSSDDRSDGVSSLESLAKGFEQQR